MVSDRDRAIREEMRDQILLHIRGLTVTFDKDGAVYRYGTVASNIDFVTMQLNGDTANPPSSL